MLNLRYPLLWWVPGCLLLASVALGSLLPGDVVPHFPIRDKLVHLATYGLLMLWFSGMVERRRLWLIALFLLVLGFVLDSAQSLTPSRSFELADVAANATGILISLVLAYFLLAGWCQRVEKLMFSRGS